MAVSLGQVGQSLPSVHIYDSIVYWPGITDNDIVRPLTTKKRAQRGRKGSCRKRTKWREKSER